MIAELNYNPFSASTLNLLTRNSLRFQPLTGGQLAAKALTGGGGGASAVSATNPEPLLNQKDPSKYGPQASEGMSTTTMAAIGIGVLAAGLVAFKLLKKKR